MGDTSDSDHTTNSAHNSTKNTRCDFSNPFFLHNSESPGVSLVNQVLTGSENYNTWNMSMIIALESKNKVGFVDGTIEVPEPNHSTYVMWKRINSMVISWIVNSVSKEIASSIIYINSTQHIWKDLKERFSKKNNPKICQLKIQICKCEQKELSVGTYFTKLRSLWDEYKNYISIPQCNNGVECSAWKSIQEMHDMEFTMQFFIGINESYTHIRSQILLYDPLPSINKAFSLVVQEERQRGLYTNNTQNAAPPQQTEPSAFVTRFDKRSSNGYHKRDRPLSSHCGFNGHTIDKCYKIHGYPPGFKGKKLAASLAFGNSEHKASDSHQPMIQEFQKLMKYFSNHMGAMNKSESIPNANVCINQQGEGSHGDQTRSGYKSAAFSGAALQPYKFAALQPSFPHGDSGFQTMEDDWIG